MTDVVDLREVEMTGEVTAKAPRASSSPEALKRKEEEERKERRPDGEIDD